MQVRFVFISIIKYIGCQDFEEKEMKAFTETSYNLKPCTQIYGMIWKYSLNEKNKNQPRCRKMRKKALSLPLLN